MGDVVRVARGGRFIGWYVRFKDADGQRKMRASHQPTKEAARRYLVEIEARIARGQVGIPEPAPLAPTVSEAVERFLTEYSRPKIKDLGRYRVTARSALQRVLPQLAALRIDAVTARHVQRVRDELTGSFAKNTARVSLAHLGTLFSWAEKAGLVSASPMRSVELPGREELVEYLSREETAALLAASEKRASQSPEDLKKRHLHICVSFALRTGLRKGELFGLRWQDVDLETRRLTVARSFKVLPKGGKPRHLRLPSALVPLLREWRSVCPRTREGLVFPVPRKRQWAMAQSSREMLGLPELMAEAGLRQLVRPWHSLRHTFASQFVMQGGNILTLQKILGHSDIKMTLVYAHLAPDFLGDEMDRVQL